jgi:hypothetical protein
MTSFERFGMKGEAGDQYLTRSMDMICGFVREIDAIASHEADAA